jgi:riboflavin transporter FmnP
LIKQKITTDKMIVMSLFSSISLLLMYLNFSLPIFPSFLKIDLADLPILLLGIIYNPKIAVLASLTKNILHIPFSTSLGIGEFINFLISIFYTYSFFVLSKKMNIKPAFIINILLTCSFALLINLYIMFPLYECFLNIKMDSIITFSSNINPFISNIKTYLLFIIFPFNLIKFSLVSILAYLIYPKLKLFLIKNIY